jgi:hypothetical protein
MIYWTHKLHQSIRVELRNLYAYEICNLQKNNSAVSVIFISPVVHYPMLPQAVIEPAHGCFANQLWNSTQNVDS